VYFRGGPRFAYHKDHEKTQAAYSLPGAEPGDAACLGDIGRMDADGYLYLVDRASFTINSGGVNIYPREIEDVLAMHPGVREAAVFAAPNRDFGEEVKAVVERSPLYHPPVGADELIAFCRARMSHFKAPRSVDFIDALPRSDAGKVLKGELKRGYWEREEAP
jgi:acyl-CoA synthetase (AMP-forming)/AMP-acid ligase II